MPILIVDNNPKDRGTKEAESFFLWKLFTEPIKGYDVQVKSAADLDNLNLQPVRRGLPLRRAAALGRGPQEPRRVRQGRRRAGLLHGPAHQVGHRSPSTTRSSTARARGCSRSRSTSWSASTCRRTSASPSSIRRTLHVQQEAARPPRHADHPALEKLYKDNRGQAVKEDEYEKFFNFVVIDRYVGVNQQQLRGAASAGVKRSSTSRTPSRSTTTPRPVNDLTDRLQQVIDNPTPKIGEVRRAAASGSAPNCGESPARRPSCTCWPRPRRSAGGPGRRTRRPSGPAWSTSGPRPTTPCCGEEFEKLRDEVKYGDPLYVAKPFGKGRVVAFLQLPRALRGTISRASAGRTTRRS